MPDPVRPIFLFSLPRSGSTLLQRILGASDQIATAVEPWLLLPVLLPLQGRPGFSVAGDKDLSAALRGFSEYLDPSGAAYRRSCREFALSLYGKAAARGKPGARYFLDKTPRYHLVCRQVLETFPVARFLFLWRNPLDVLCSMLRTWCLDRWNPFEFEVDLTVGLRLLTEAFEEHAGRSHSVRYEDLTARTEETLGGIARYLEIELDLPDRLEPPPVSATLGDRTGAERYATLSTASQGAWRTMLSSGPRRRWIGRYLDANGERIAAIGYGDLRREFEEERRKARTDWGRSLADRYWGARYLLAARYNLNTVRDQRSLVHDATGMKLR